MENLREFHQIGDDTPERIVPENVCRGLRARGLGVCGLSDAGRGYCMARPRPAYGHLLVSYGGAGEAWVGGKWVECGPGQAYLAPPLTPSGFRTTGGRRWQFGWVFLPVTDDEASPVPGDVASLIATDPRQLVNAIEGLYLEAVGPVNVQRLDLWAELVSDYRRATMRAAGTPDPLWRLWAAVDASPGEPWTLERLASSASLRPEALRRTCLKHLGRSPMRQVTHLRMRRAEALLRSTSGKLFNVARQVGYHNTFAFSTAFARWKGRPPKSVRGETAADE